MKKHGKYSSNKGLNMKPLAILLALTLLVGCAVGGTLAWLTAQTEEVTNTFTVGDINIKLEETVDDEFHFVPGDKLAKDPKVTVNPNSEACYLFVKVTVANNSATDDMDTADTDDDVTANPIVNFTVDSDWKYIENAVEVTAPASYVNGTYYFYREVTKSDAAQPFYILAGEGTGDYANGFVTISDQVTKGMVESINGNKPSVAFEAAAVQSENIADLAAAWNALPTAFKSTT